MKKTILIMLIFVLVVVSSCGPTTQEPFPSPDDPTGQHSDPPPSGSPPPSVSPPASGGTTPSDPAEDTGGTTTPPTNVPGIGYHTSGNKIYDGNGDEAILNGIAWFGFETSNYVLHGLWSRNFDDMLDQIADLGYNFLRVPFCNDMFDATTTANGIDFWSNPELKNKKPIEILDMLVQKAEARGMKIMLDRHRPSASDGGPTELWYTLKITEQRWINDWVMLAKRYKDSAAVIAMDLHNEPHGKASWGTGVTTTDWRLAAEKAGNAILAVNQNVLIVVEGVETNVKNATSSYWWGGNLKGVRNFPVRLSMDDKIVYSPHEYGPGVYNQTWFSASNFPNNLKALWNEYWSYIHTEQIAPIMIGEFGGRNVDTVTKEGVWQNAVVDLIADTGMYWTYWCWNPNSGDTGGVLKDDWTTINQAKQNMLDRIIQ